MAPPPCETRIFNVGKSLNTSELSSDSTPMLSSLMKCSEYGNRSDRQPAEWMCPGTSSATIFSYSGYQNRSPSGGVSTPLHSPGSGLSRQPTNPCSLTHFSRYGTTAFGLTPGVSGSPQTPRKVFG